MDPQSTHSSKDEERVNAVPRNRTLPNIWQRLDEHLPSWNNWASLDDADSPEESGELPKSSVKGTAVERLVTPYKLRPLVVPGDARTDSAAEGRDAGTHANAEEISGREGIGTHSYFDGGSPGDAADDLQGLHPKKHEQHEGQDYREDNGKEYGKELGKEYGEQAFGGYKPFRDGDSDEEEELEYPWRLSGEHPSRLSGDGFSEHEEHHAPKGFTGTSGYSDVFDPSSAEWERFSELTGKTDDASANRTEDSGERIADSPEDVGVGDQYIGEDFGVVVEDGTEEYGVGLEGVAEDFGVRVDGIAEDVAAWESIAEVGGVGVEGTADDFSFGVEGIADDLGVGDDGIADDSGLGVEGIADDLGLGVEGIADDFDFGGEGIAGDVGAEGEDFIEDVNPTRNYDASSREKRPDADEGDLTALNLRDRVVIMLLFKQIVQFDKVEKAWRDWNARTGGKSKELLWRVLTMDASFDREKIFAEAAQVYAFRQAEIDHAAALQFIKKHQSSFPEQVWESMRNLRVVPIRHETQARSREKRLIFVSHDPSRPEVNRLMSELRLEGYELQYAPEAQIDRLLTLAFPKRNEFLDRVSDDEFALDLGTSYDEELIDESALEAEISRSSLINLFEAALVEAVRRGVSDIHIFPNPRKQIEIHFRVDGDLELWHREERVAPEAFLAVVKDNTLNVDRFERDAAQDGFIQRKIDDTLIRYRVSVLPVANANQELRSESVVIRVLDDRNVITDLRRLGLLDRARETFEWAIRQPYGMVILTGPTGSGKTTTLFAALSQVVTPKRNVLTVEDPVEYVIPGVRQIKLSHKLVLEQALRSILRHDPDIVMVGEMRDRETAELAIKLANTGHLTFSTLHTNDAPSAISRLYKMGIEPFLIAYAINLIVAQRLVRTLCPQCKRPDNAPDHEVLGRLGFTPHELATTQFFSEGGDSNCQTCGGTGFKGRRAITETMAFSHEIRRLIISADKMIDEDAIRQQAMSEGMLTLRASAREVVIRGEMSMAELIRTTAGEL